jgi:hypothetical protein
MDSLIFPYGLLFYTPWMAYKHLKFGKGKLAANGRRDTKHGRGQPGRAPCLGGAARCSTAEPGGPQSI